MIANSAGLVEGTNKITFNNLIISGKNKEFYVPYSNGEKEIAESNCLQLKKIFSAIIEFSKNEREKNPEIKDDTIFSDLSTIDYNNSDLYELISDVRLFNGNFSGRFYLSSNSKDITETSVEELDLYVEAYKKNPSFNLLYSMRILPNICFYLMRLMSGKSSSYYTNNLTNTGIDSFSYNSSKEIKELVGEFENSNELDYTLVDGKYKCFSEVIEKAKELIISAIIASHDKKEKILEKIITKRPLLKTEELMFNDKTLKVDYSSGTGGKGLKFSSSFIEKIKVAISNYIKNSDISIENGEYEQDSLQLGNEDKIVIDSLNEDTLDSKNLVTFITLVHIGLYDSDGVFTEYSQNLKEFINNFKIDDGDVIEALTSITDQDLFDKNIFSLCFGGTFDYNDGINTIKIENKDTFGSGIESLSFRIFEGLKKLKEDVRNSIAEGDTDDEIYYYIEDLNNNFYLSSPKSEENKNFAIHGQSRFEQILNYFKKNKEERTKISEMIQIKSKVRSYSEENYVEFSRGDNKIYFSSNSTNGKYGIANNFYNNFISDKISGIDDLAFSAAIFASIPQTNLSTLWYYKASSISYYNINDYKKNNGYFDYSKSNDDDYTNRKDLIIFSKIENKGQSSFSDLEDKIIALFLERFEEIVKKEEAEKELLKTVSNFVSKAKMNIDTVFKKEKDFFYIDENDTSIPANYFADVSFHVANIEKDKNKANFSVIFTDGETLEDKEPKWISVTKKNVITPAIDVDNIHDDNYFKSIKIADSCEGGKELTLVLSSFNDLNLENIINSSIVYTKFSTKNSDSMNSVEDTAVIRVKYGYNIYPESKQSSFNSGDWSKRTKVRVSKKDGSSSFIFKPSETPVMYFMIKDISVDFDGDKTTFTISGQNLGKYLLNKQAPACNMNEIVLDQDKDVDVVTGLVGSALYRYSEGKICLLSSEQENSIIVGSLTKNSKISGDSKTTFRTKKLSLVNSKDEVYKSDKIEKIFNNGKEINYFTIESTRENKLNSYQEILDALMNFLPRQYYFNQTGKDVFRIDANQLQSEGIDLSRVISVSPKYSVIETKINKDGGGETPIFLIKIYYEKPTSRQSNDIKKGIGDTYESEYRRVYGIYDSQNTIVKSFSVDSSQLNFALISNMLGTKGVEQLYQELYETNINLKSGSIAIKKTEKDAKKVFNVSSESINIDPSNTTEEQNYNDNNNALKNNLTIPLTALDYLGENYNFPYTATLEIIGDPFFCFDRVMEPMKYSIVLEIKRAKDANKKNIGSSIYSGTYRIKTIEQNIAQDGFSTKLSLLKDDFSS